MACVETDKDGFQCAHDGMHYSDHFNANGRWPATRESCAKRINDFNYCHRDDYHDGECRPSGWIAPKSDTRPIVSETDYLLWAAALIAVLVVIGQLAAERERQKRNGHYFQWLEID